VRPILISVIAFACVLGGTFLGIFLRHRLPEEHLSESTKDVVRLGTGLIGTIAALVLGLLIASASSTFQTRSNQVEQLTADVVVLDQTLAQYGVGNGFGS
jgi:fluoride ion exporter CrcB/FEX